MKKTLLMTFLLSAGFSMAEAQQLAFPGAEGFGKYAVGGRNGSVYHVTNLNDSGAGSLRDAVSKPNRIIVFDVAGVIKLESRLVFSNNLYVAGQTAPGEGITVYGNGVSFSGASNSIVRYLRFRMGVGGDSGKDAAGVANGTNMIFDHLSVSWGRDETFSISSDGKGALGDITIQNSIISQGLLTHSAGGLMQADNITLYRNLYVDNSTRNNKIKGKNQYVNNIVYNWQNGCYIMGGDSEGTSYAIAEGNLFINGPSGGGNAFGGGNSDYHIYATDNWQDKNKDGLLNPYEIPQNEYSGGPTFHAERFDYPEVPLWKSAELIEKNLPIVGASLPYRDYADWYVINEVKSFGKKGGLISRETSLPFGAPTDWALWEGNKKADADGDGMPDAWESANGTDPAKNDAMTIAANGYANIENYINSITVEDRDFYLRKPLCLSLTTSTQTALGFSWLNYTEGATGIAVELKEGDTFKEIDRLAADASNYTLKNLTAETAYTIRLRAFDDNGNFSDYSDELTVKTKPLAVDMVDVETYVPDYAWGVGNGVWDFATSNWGGVYTDASKVLFDPNGRVDVTLNETVSPVSVVVKGADTDTLTISGEGAIAGAATVNKAGESLLVLNNKNTYTGQTVLHGGTIEFNSLANGGVASAIGASSEFAQNWVWDGGVWSYTGSSVATNRQALAYDQTEFNIANKATVTMNGHIEGTGGLTLNGNGQMTVNTTNFFQYTGPTILKGSTLLLNSIDISKAGIGKSSKLVMNGGELKTKGDNNNYETYSFPIEVLEGETSYFSPHRNCYINNKVTGTGTLQFNVPYLREYVGNGFNSFKGRLVANGVNSAGDNLLLINKGADPFANCVVELKGKAKMGGWDTNGNYKIGGLSGDAGTSLCGSSKNTKGFKCTWTVGDANNDETFKGVINDLPAGLNSAYSGTVSIVKKGSGDWRLTGSNTYSGTTMITGGRLVVNGTNSGTGAVSVYKGATLAGRGTVNAKVSVKNGGTVATGDTIVNNAHMLKLKGGLTVESGGTVSIPVKVSATGATVTACKLVVTGAMAINDATLNIEYESGWENVKTGTVFNLFTMSGVTSVTGTGFTAIEPAVPGEGLEWDTTDLLTEGRLRVKEASSIDYTSSDDEATVWPLAVQSELNVSLPVAAQVAVYSLAGEQVKHVALQQGTSTVGMSDLSKGIYLVKAGDKVFRIVKK